MSSSSSSSANPQAIKRRRRTTKQELQVLEDLYAEVRYSHSLVCMHTIAHTDSPHSLAVPQSLPRSTAKGMQRYWIRDESFAGVAAEQAVRNSLSIWCICVYVMLNHPLLMPTAKKKRRTRASGSLRTLRQASRRWEQHHTRRLSLCPPQQAVVPALSPRRMRMLLFLLHYTPLQPPSITLV